VIHLEKERNVWNLKDEEYISVYPISLKSFEKIVYLSPYMLVSNRGFYFAHKIIQNLNVKLIFIYL